MDWILNHFWLVPALPFASFWLILFFGRRFPGKGAEIGIGALGAAWVASAWAALAWIRRPTTGTGGEAIRKYVEHTYTWFNNGQIKITFGFHADGLAVMMIVVVSTISLLVHVYSVEYMRGDQRYTYFFAALSLFTCGMYVLVTASSTLQGLFGWEAMGVCSFMLIGHWWEDQANSNAALKAFFTTRTGDIGLLVGISILYFGAHQTFNWESLNQQALSGRIPHTVVLWGAIALMIAVIGKSAQFPLHTWLPDAMAGPTPVSALIHAATMVVAGVYLVARTYGVFWAAFSIGPGTHAHHGFNVLAIVGATTIIIAALLAFVQDDIKKVLAYSTVSQLGYMVMALACGAWVGGIFHLFTHAFFKACLFLGAGSVLHGNADNQDMRIMGALRRFMPYTAGAMVVAWLAIAGAPPFDGFWAKDGVLEAAYVHHDFGIWAVGIVAAVMTGLYMTRLILLTFYGNARWGASDAPAVAAVSGGSDDDAAAGDDVEVELGYDPDDLPTVVYGEPPRTPRLHGHEPHESPGLMVLPIVALALLSIIGGLVNIPLRGLTRLDSWLEPVFHGARVTESFAGAAELSATAIVFGLVGILVAFVFYRRGLRSPADDPLQARLGVVADVVGHGYYCDDAISKAVDGPVRAAATFLDRDVDQRVIDGAVNGTAHLVRRAAEGLRHAQDGLVRRYAIGIALGAAAILLFFLAYAGR